MTNKHSIVSLSDDDFGFSTIDEKELVKVQTDDLTGQVEELTSRLQKMYDAIMPLLRNLNKNCDQEIIKWSFVLHIHQAMGNSTSWPY